MSKKYLSRQIFQITHAPEAKPLSQKMIERILSAKRPDSEWDVKEMELTPARLTLKKTHREERRNNDTD